MKVFDECPIEFNPTGLGKFVRVNSGHELEYNYAVTPVVRGQFQIDTTTLIVRSIANLWEFKLVIPNPSQVNVYPDFAAISRFLELAAVERTAQVGVKLVARRGSGLEFHQLREYRLGDPINHLDWKATAKRHKLISREYQDERDQQICVLMDSGMSMRMKDGELSSFDHALNALILVSYVALRQGDSVAVQFFGHSDKWQAPVKGPNSINTLLNSVFDVHSGPVLADYVAAAETLLVRQRKRSLVLLITNAREKETDLPTALKLLSARHLTVLVNLRDRIVDEIVERDVRTFDDAILVAERAQFLQDRRHHQTKCSRSCHLILDCKPQELLVQLTNTYWQIKRSGAL